MKIHKKLAKAISHGGIRNKKTIKYIVIHYTGNKGDTAAGNANYFATSNTRKAGAHFFVDKSGTVYKSVNMNCTAWSVGGLFTKADGAGSYYGKCTNSNSVSIELCDLRGKPGWKQMTACRKLVQYIQKYCPNAKKIIRHWDVNGKSCPASMTGKKNPVWTHFKCFLENGYLYKAQIKKDTPVYATSVDKKSTGVVRKGANIRIYHERNGRVRLLTPDADGRKRWIDSKAVKEK